MQQHSIFHSLHRVLDKLRRTCFCAQALHAVTALVSDLKRVARKVCIVHLLCLIVDLGKQQPQHPFPVFPSQLLQSPRKLVLEQQQVMTDKMWLELGAAGPLGQADAVR